MKNKTRLFHSLMELLSKFPHFVSCLAVVFDPPFTYAASGSNTADEGEGLLLRAVLVNIVTSLVTVGALISL